LGAAALHASIYAGLLIPTARLNYVLLALLVCYMVVSSRFGEPTVGPRFACLEGVVGWYVWLHWAVFGLVLLDLIHFPGPRFLGVKPDAMKAFWGAQACVTMLGSLALQGSRAEPGRRTLLAACRRFRQPVRLK
jgi:hypothetical protein